MSRYLPVLSRILTRRAALGALSAAAVTVALAAVPQPARADIAALADATKEMAVGKADAPLTIVEYASLGCPHCAHFHHDVLPSLTKDYIETGKVRLVFHDFPLGTPALAAAMIARCSGPERYFGFVDMFFRTQKQWGTADNPLDALTRVARFGGMAEADVKACLNNQALLDHLQKTKKQAFEERGVDATPYFFVGTEKVSGGLPYDEFKAIVERNLAKAK